MVSSTVIKTIILFSFKKYKKFRNPSFWAIHAAHMIQKAYEKERQDERIVGVDQ